MRAEEATRDDRMRIAEEQSEKYRALRRAGAVGLQRLVRSWRLSSNFRGSVPIIAKDDTARIRLCPALASIRYVCLRWLFITNDLTF